MIKYYKEIVFFISSIIFFITSLFFWYLDFSTIGFQFINEFYIFEYCILLGIDSISFLFIFLTSLIIPLCILYNWHTVKSINEHFFSLCILLLIEILLILVFSILELVFFYIVFEFLLIPFYYIIILTSNKRFLRNTNEVNKKINAFYLLFFYTILGSLFMLIAILIIYINLGTTLIPLLWYSHFNIFLEKLLWFLFFISFSVKIPIIPVHLWLPEAHVESPTEGSVILAAILLKIGVYGIIRIVLPSFEEATIYYSIFVWMLSILSIIYTSMSACVQIDIKRIIAYASIGHMNMCILGIFSLDISSIYGSIIVMFAHGLTSAGLFFIIGILYTRYHTKNIKYYNSIVIGMPLLSIFFFLFTISNFSLPGTLNFIGEFFIFTSFFKWNIFYIYFSVFFSILLCSFYSIYLFNHITYGNVNHTYYYNSSDLNIREFIILLILIILIFSTGFFTNFISDILKLDLNYYYVNYGE